MYDNLCKYLIETFPKDFAQWLLGQPITLEQLSPRELSSEPIRADSLILLQSQAVVLHVEFQTRTDKTMSFRMLDYFTRLRRKFPERRIHQVVVYLLETHSPLVYEDQFTSDKTQHRYEVVRLWEQPKNLFIHSLGLLPLAVMANPQPDEPEQVLQAVAQQIDAIKDTETRNNLTASAALLAGLKLEKDIIWQIFRSEAMRESVIYQDILQEGRQEGEQRGIEKGRKLERVSVLRTIIPLLKRFKFPVEVLLNALGVTMAEVEDEGQEQEDGISY
ncbi:MAG: Rpn family recombination-promoting nuclease/putative transposase [Cyanobacteria bacterium P01_G01_bin.54]